MNAKNETEVLMKTSDVIYEHNRIQKLEKPFYIKIVFLISCLLSICSIIIICMLQYDKYFANINQRYDYLNETRGFCDKSELSTIDIISTPIAGFLIILYIIIYKRRVFLRNRFKYRNVGLPMVVSVWNKVIFFISGICT